MKIATDRFFKPRKPIAMPGLWGGKRNGHHDANTGKGVTILFGSQTGNAEFIAKETCKYLKSKGVKVSCRDMYKYKPDKIAEEQQLLLVVSTHGEGEPPDAAEKFYRFLFETENPNLSNLQYAVCALGDSSYDHFCKTGRDIDCRLEKLGGKRICPCMECDVDFRDDAVEWIAKTYRELAEKHKQMDDGYGAEPEKIIEEEKWYPAKITDKYLLSGKHAEKENWHISFTVNDPAFSYKPGDCIGIVPKNDEMLVTMLLDQLGFSGSEIVKTTAGHERLFDALQKRYEITTVTRQVLERYVRAAKQKAIADLLNDSQKAGQYIANNDVLDMLQDYPVSLSSQAFIDLLAPIQHRLYSIASGPDVKPGQVDITVRSVKLTYRDRLRKGACSVQLGDRFQINDEVRVFVKPNNHFRLPQNPETPVIMIAAGTGIAPFRAFLQQRDLSKAQGKNWLFFGDRRREHDFLYQKEIADYHEKGLLTELELAFSRDGADKKYVQHPLFEKRKEVLAWLDNGAHIYVCGLLQMADALRECMVDIFTTEKGCTPEQASEYLHQLKAEKRYCEDAY